MRSLAEQTVAELGGAWSVLTRQKRDHEVLDGLLEQVQVTRGATQEVVLHRIYRLVFSHAFAEESVLWPALRRSLPDGEELTSQVEQEHQEITELVAELEASDPDDPDRPALLERTIEVLRKDVRDEEDLLLPRLQENVDVKELRRLGIAWEAVRRVAPTRTHPIVARRPPGNVLAALPLSVIDRSRDVLDRVGRRASPRTQGALGTASRGLAAAARRIEHLPPLRVGERPETRFEGGTTP